MTVQTEIAIIGAGPYGLSLAAHLDVAGADFRIFGPPMQFWREHMPEGMVLKSEGFASSLWHPYGAWSLHDYCQAADKPYRASGLPVPLQTFCDYGLSFQQQFAPGLDPRPVANLDEDTAGYTLRLADGPSVTARRVVLAVGIGSFASMPPELQGLPAALCSHSSAVHKLDGFAGKDVLIIGGGASAVETAALISQKGGRATVVTRHERIAYCSPPQPRALWDRIKAPETGLGTGWRSWACVTAPMLFYHLPRDFRHLIVRKHLGPAPGWTCRTEVERNVRVILAANVVSAQEENGQAVVRIREESGAETRVEADHVIAATGFQIDMRRLSFLSPSLLARIRCAENTPDLSPHFETSVRNLFVIGAAAANNFGPLLRFAYGARFAARRLSEHLLRTEALDRRHAPERRSEVAMTLASAD